MKRKKKIFISTSAICALVIAGLFIVKNKTINETVAVETNVEDEINVTIDTDLLSSQEEVEADLSEEGQNHTFEDPYIALNPYGTSPLSAVVLFTTDEATQISFTVQGKTDSADISETIDEYTTSHEIPILGLYADYNNTIEITSTTESGSVSTTTITIQTEALPDSFPTITVEEADETAMETLDNGLTFVIPSTKWPYGFDVNGDVRWYSTRYNSHVFQELENGHILFLGKHDNSGDTYNLLLEMDFTGKLYQAYSFEDSTSVAEQTGAEQTTIHHDAIELPSGNLLLTVGDGSNYVEDTMIEIDRETGEIVKSIDLKDLLPEEFYTEYDSTTREDGTVDWFHQNSVVYDESDNSIIISGRNQDTVMKIDYETDEIIWILSDPEGWPSEYEDLLLTADSEDFKYPGGQHAAVILPDQDNNDATIDILLYDNNVAVTRGDEDLSKTYSAATQYRINETDNTVEIVWTYGEELGEDFFTNIVGSARYLTNTGNRLINFGYVQQGSISTIIEVDDEEDANTVFKAIISDFPQGAWAYRAERRSLYADNWTYSLGD